jgi:hypothetical protein
VLQIPNWNRVTSALPEFLDELRDMVDADAAESRSASAVARTALAGQ